MDGATFNPQLWALFGASRRPGVASASTSLPRTVDGIGQWVFSAIETVFERRRAGIENVYDQSKERDPPPATPIWKSILKAAVAVAINAVTAGLGAKIANAIVTNADARHFTTEMVKVLFEQSMSTTAEAAAAAVIDGNAGGGDARNEGRKPQKGIRRTLGITFRDAQDKALSLEKLAKKQRNPTTIENMVKRKESERPGSGFREALKLDATIKQHIATAETDQYIDTFQAWCSVLASNTLNEEHDGPAANLGKTAGVNRFLRSDDGWGRSANEDPGFARTPGVLNLELAEDEQRTVRQGDRQTHPLKVRKATISGLDSQDFRATIKDVPIRDLKMPLVAAFQQFLRRTRYSRAIGGFAIGRNELHQYWASEEGEYLSVWTAIRMGKGGKADVQEAARYIIEHEIGSTTVEPHES